MLSDGGGRPDSTRGPAQSWEKASGNGLGRGDDRGAHGDVIVADNCSGDVDVAHEEQRRESSGDQSNRMTGILMPQANNAPL